MGREQRQPPSDPLMPLFFLVLGVFGVTVGVFQGVDLLLYGSILCFAVAYVSYAHGKVLMDLQRALPKAPTRLLLLLGGLAIVSGLLLWSIRSGGLADYGPKFPVEWAYPLHPYSSQATGLLLLGLIAIVMGLATRRPRVAQ